MKLAPHIFQIEYSVKYERQSWPFGNLREDNDFADVTLACEDDQQVEAHNVILAAKVLFNRLFHSHHHININVIVVKQAKGSSWVLVVKPAYFP